MDIYELAQAQRAAVLANDKATRDTLIEAYAVADKDLQARLSALLDLIERRREAGEDVSRSWFQKETRYNALLNQVHERTKELAGMTASETQRAVQTNLQNGTSDALALIEAAQGRAVVAGAFDRLNTRAPENITAYMDANAPLGRLLARIMDEMPADAVKAAKNVLFIWVSTGQNPRVVARNFQAVTGASLTRSLTIARTEQLRAYRQASLQTYEESEAISGWQWLCTKSARTCVACLAQDGRVYEKSAQFMAHVRCRCTTVPVVVQPRPRETGEEWLRAQDTDTQNKVMGPAAATAWCKGEVRLSDFVGVRRSKEWGDSVYHDSLKAARERAKNRARKQVQYDANPDAPRSFGSAKAQQAAMEPVGQKLSELAQVPQSRPFQVFRNALQSVDAVHGFGDTNLPNLSFRFAPLPVGEAEYDNRTDPPIVRLLTKAQDPVFSIIHEVGHFVADKGLGQTGRTARYDTETLRDWQAAIQSSRAIASLKQVKDAAQRDSDADALEYADYLLADSEIWARAYAQYVAVRSGDRAALNSVADRRARPADEIYFARQWDDDDFEPIARALDGLLTGLKWARDKK